MAATARPEFNPELAAHVGRFSIVALPNISHVLYGRDVGYAIENVVLDADTEVISATGNWAKTTVFGSGP